MGISAVVAAMMGLSVLLMTGVLTWKDCLTYPPAWDTLFWFAVLVGAFPPPPNLLIVTRCIPRETTLIIRAHAVAVHRHASNVMCECGTNVTAYADCGSAGMAAMCDVHATSTVNLG